jgi:hypothetical protein
MTGISKCAGGPDHSGAVGRAGIDVVDVDQRSDRAMTMLDDWATTSWHECGHVAGYLHFCWRFGGVKIWRDDNGQICGSVVSPAANYNCFARAICCMAGPVAEELLTGVPIAEQTASAGDIAMAKEALARVGKEFDIAVVIPATRLLIESAWETLQVIGSQLLARKQLDYGDVMRLIESV